MQEKQLKAIERRRSPDDIPELVKCVRELQDVLERSLKEGGHAEDCGLLRGKGCDCWVSEAVEAECGPVR